MPSFSTGGFAGLVRHYKTIGKKAKKRKKAKGRKNGLGGVAWNAPAQSATLFVGLTKGKKPLNAAGRCPRKFTAKQAEKVFVKARAEQVGRPNVAGTLGFSRGYYHGDGEETLVIQIVNEGEPFGEFKQKALELADKIGRQMCQDSVIVVSDDAQTREATGTEWET